MRIRRPSDSRLCPGEVSGGDRPGRVRGGEQGSALLVVLVLLLAMTAIVMSNQLVLRHLKREIKLVDQQQLRKYQKLAERLDSEFRAVREDRIVNETVDELPGFIHSTGRVSSWDLQWAAEDPSSLPVAFPERFDK